MKAFNTFNLSYSALILLYGNVLAVPDQAEPPNQDESSLLPYTSNHEASYFVKLTTDPRHAWWKDSLAKRDPSPSPSPTVSPVVLPTKCQYVAANTSPSCDKGCIYPKPQYHVCTNWMINHGYQLRAAFKEAGFESVPNRTRCGWQSFTHVTALGVGRGSIDVNGTEAQDHGDPYELARIEDVMRGEYPFVEIIILLATLLGPLVLLGGGLGWCMWAAQARKVKYRYQRLSTI